MRFSILLQFSAREAPGSTGLTDPGRLPTWTLDEVWHVIFSGRRALATAAILALVTAGPAAGSEGEAVPSGATSTGLAWEEIGAKTLDVLVLRPLGAAATVGGVAFFVASVPLVAPAGRIGTSWDILVGAPADYTFVRPLGDF